MSKVLLAKDLYIRASSFEEAEKAAEALRYDLDYDDEVEWSAWATMLEEYEVEDENKTIYGSPIEDASRLLKS